MSDIITVSFPSCELSHTTRHQSQGTGFTNVHEALGMQPISLLAVVSQGGRLPHRAQYSVHYSILSAMATKAHLTYY